MVTSATSLSDSSKKVRKTNTGKSTYFECVFIQEDKDNLWQRELLPISEIKNGPLTNDDEKNKIKEILRLNGYDGRVRFSDSKIPLRK